MWGALIQIFQGTKLYSFIRTLIVFGTSTSLRQMWRRGLPIFLFYFFFFPTWRSWLQSQRLFKISHYTGTRFLGQLLTTFARNNWRQRTWKRNPPHAIPEIWSSLFPRKWGNYLDIRWEYFTFCLFSQMYPNLSYLKCIALLCHWELRGFLFYFLLTAFELLSRDF